MHSPSSWPGGGVFVDVRQDMLSPRKSLWPQSVNSGHDHPTVSLGDCVETWTVIKKNSARQMVSVCHSFAHVRDWEHTPAEYSYTSMACSGRLTWEIGANSLGCHCPRRLITSTHSAPTSVQSQVQVHNIHTRTRWGGPCYKRVLIKKHSHANHSSWPTESLVWFPSQPQAIASIHTSPSTIQRESCLGTGNRGKQQKCCARQPSLESELQATIVTHAHAHVRIHTNAASEVNPWSP